jgi:Ca2+-binding EF-hand superfamily protein
MKIYQSILAAAIVATLPLASFAGDKDKTVTTTTTRNSAQFDTLDTNRDGRISATEASVDSKIMFSAADKNGDGYLDSNEYMHRGMTNDSMPSDSATDTETPRK